MRIQVAHADCLEWLRDLPAGSVDAIVTDPPYGLEFMGKEWDHGVPGRPFWETALRVAKPGAHLVAFGGTRTFHRLTCAIEDAGFEVRDCLTWLYGSGFPKSMDVAKAIDKAARGFPQGGPDPSSPAHGRFKPGCSPESPRGRGYGAGPGAFLREGVGERAHAVATGAGLRNRHAACGKPYFSADPCVCPDAPLETPEARAWQGFGTALKPAWEPIVLCRKPLEGTVAEGVLRHGTGALNIDGCRIAAPGGSPSIARRAEAFAAPAVGGIWPTRRAGAGEAWLAPHPGEELGRWPANVLLDEEAASRLDAEVGMLRSGANPSRRGPDGDRVGFQGFPGQEQCQPARGEDSGGPSRFFYCAKASRSEREEGLQHLDALRRTDGREALDGPGASNPRLRSAARRNDHPTVKPLELMRWLVRLVTPPGGLVLDPFMGSGTTGLACLEEGRSFLGIEKVDRYMEIARGRILARARRTR